MEVPPDLQFVGRKEKERKEREKRKRGGGSTVALRHLWSIEVYLLARSDSPRSVPSMLAELWNCGTVERRNSENLGWYSQETREEERDRKVGEDKKKRCECEEEWKWREDCENLRNHSKLSEEDKPAAGHHSYISRVPTFFLLPLRGTKQVLLLVFHSVPQLAPSQKLV